MNEETLKRFWLKVDKNGPVPKHKPELGPCWIWKASKRAKGYGAFIWADKDGKIVQGRAHRFSWEIHNGSIPDGQCALHKCDDPPCCNPTHLFLGTKAENNEDMHAKGRAVCGGTHCGAKGKYEKHESHHNAKFTWDDINAIRASASSGLSFSELAKRFKTSPSNIWKIIKYKAWKIAIT